MSGAQPPGEQPSARPDTPSPPTGPAAQDPSSLDLEQVTRVWPAVLDRVLQTAPALAATFEGARPVAVDTTEQVVTVGFPAAHTFNKRKAEAPEKREQVEEALAAVLGARLRLAYVVLDGEDTPGDPGAAGKSVDTAALVERIKSEFDAEEV